MKNPVSRRAFVRSAAIAVSVAPWFVMPRAWGADMDPVAMIQQLSDQVLDLIRTDERLHRGDLKHITEVVDRVIMPNVNFTRMTASAVGPAWWRATPEQRQQLQEQFKTLLIHTYAGALDRVDHQSVQVKPLRAGVTAEDKEVVVNTLVRGTGDPVAVDYRMERTPGQGLGWKVYDLNVLGVWLVANYRSQFAQQVNRDGIDGLIAALEQRNRDNAASGAAN